MQPRRNAQGARRRRSPAASLEHDRPVVLLAGPVLREQAGEVSAVDVKHDLGAIVERARVRPGSAGSTPEQGVGLVDDGPVAGIQEETKPLGSRELADVAVSEVQAEELGVVSVREDEPPDAPPAAQAPPAARDIRRPAPVAHRRPRDAQSSCDLAVVHALLDEHQRRFANLPVVHERMFASRPAEDQPGSTLRSSQVTHARYGRQASLSSASFASSGSSSRP